MKLLFDENLSPRLVGELSSHWPGSTHIELLGMRGASTAAVATLFRANALLLKTFTLDPVEALLSLEA